MRCRPEPTDAEFLQEKIARSTADAYQSIVGTMNRAERRTARGRQLVAQGLAAALQAENDILKDRIKELEGGAA
jgi:hypothetical protein